ncbi:MAG: glycosyltransferase [Polaribacter sp.]
MKLEFSIIIPVYNRPREIHELLDSIMVQDFEDDFEVLVVEDGSSQTSEEICNGFIDKINLKYFFKENTGAGKSRNYGMERASGNYFIILDSDVILPKTYLKSVKEQLTQKFTDAFGGPDAAHSSFSKLQKAINYSMTSFLTTGGIRGKKNGVGKFQLRSFNLGISQEAFKKTNGFSDMKIAEDIDLTFRLWEAGFETQLITDAFVYHKRRTSLLQFLKQTYQFGKARPKLNQKYPGSGKITFWFPSLFLIGFDISILLAFFGEFTGLGIYYLYFLVVFLDAAFVNGIRVGILAIITTFTQFLGYGYGFLESVFGLDKFNWE